MHVPDRCPVSGVSHPQPGDRCPPGDARCVVGSGLASSVEVWGWLRGDVLGLLQLGAGVLLALAPGDGCAAGAPGAAAARCLVSAALSRLEGDLGHTPAATSSSGSDNSSNGLQGAEEQQQVQEVLQLAAAQLPGMLGVAQAALQEPVCCWGPAVAGYQQHMRRQLEATQALRRACLAAHDLRAAQLKGQRCTISRGGAGFG